MHTTAETARISGQTGDGFGVGGHCGLCPGVIQRANGPQVARFHVSSLTVVFIWRSVSDCPSNPGPLAPVEMGIRTGSSFGHWVASACPCARRWAVTGRYRKDFGD